LGKPVTLADICYEWNTKAEIVPLEAILPVVALTSLSPLTGRFSALKKKASALAAETNVLYLLGIIDKHYALIIIPLFVTQAPTCFDTYVPSSGCVIYPCELLKV
jgi:hypothetical protein